MEVRKEGKLKVLGRVGSALDQKAAAWEVSQMLA